MRKKAVKTKSVKTKLFKKKLVQTKKLLDEKPVWDASASLVMTPNPAFAKRKWVGLTDEEIVLIVAECAASHQHTDIHFAKTIEAKLKEKNNG